MAKPNLRGTRVGGAGRPSPQRRAALMNYWYGGGGAKLMLSTEAAIEFTGTQSRAGIWIGTHNLRSPVMLWHNGKTYNCYPGPGDSDGFNQAYVIVYDENNGVGRPFRVGNILDAEDGHSVPTMWINESGLYIFQEHTHDTNIHIYKGVDHNQIDLLDEQIGEDQGNDGQLSYNHFVVDAAGNAITWCRHIRSDFSYSGNHTAVVKASNGFEQWGTVTRVATNPRPQLNGAEQDDRTRLYPVTPYYRQKVGEYWYVMNVLRVEDNSVVYGSNICWNKYYLYKTKDFIVFENVIGTPHSHDTSDSNYLTETIMDDHYLLYDSGSSENNAQIPVMTVGPGGEVYCVTGIEDTGNLQLLIVKDRVLTTKDLNISNVVNTHPDQSHRVWHLAAFSGYLEVAALIEGDPYDKIHLFRSTDSGDTFEDLGDMLPEIEDDIIRVVFPMNYHDIPAGRNFVIQFHVADGDLRKMIFKRACKGSVKVETPNIIVPASSYSDAHDIFRYRATTADIVRSGNNVSQLTDLFALRNAIGTNNPQWNGSDAITLNGTNNYFTISPSGISFSKMTLFAVVKTSGIQIIVLDISDNTKPQDFLSFQGYNTAPGSPRITTAAGTIYNEDGQSNSGDGEYHLVVFVVDGRCKFDMYVDGLKQFYGTGTRIDQRGKILFTPTTMRIGSRDTSGTDVYTPLNFKELIFKSTVYDYDTFRSLEKKLANDHGITLDYGYL